MRSPKQQPRERLKEVLRLAEEAREHGPGAEGSEEEKGAWSNAYMMVILEIAAYSLAAAIYPQRVA